MQVLVVDRHGQVKPLEFDESQEPKQGGEALIFFTTDNRYALKFYHPTHVGGKNPDAILEIIKAAPEEHDPTAKLFGFPIGMLCDAETRFLGVQMRNVMLDGWLEELIWYTSRKMYRSLDPEKRGDFRGRVKAAIQIADAIRYLNLKGFAQGDISGRNFLINPVDGRAVLIDLDGLTVPGHMESGVIGTPGYMAPELIIGWTEQQLVRPDRLSDRHALAVLLYQLLLMTHPLLDGVMPALSESAEEDAMLRMGREALYVEHPIDKRNQLRPGAIMRTDLLGDELKTLFRQAFVDGLNNPSLRPQHAEWMSALKNLLEDVVTCQNPACELRAFPSLGNHTTHCPFCGTEAKYDMIGNLIIFAASRGDTGFFRRAAAIVHRIPMHGRVTVGQLFDSADDTPVLHVSKRGTGWKVRMIEQVRPMLCQVYDIRGGFDPYELRLGSETDFSSEQQLVLRHEKHGVRVIELRQ